MRFQGRLASWNEDRGFGFIESTSGGDTIFVHIKAFKPRSGRPIVGQIVSFEIEVGLRNKKRAKNVEPIRATSRRPVASARGSRIDGRPFLAILAFLAVYVAVALVWRVAPWVAGLYAVLSVVCAIVYLIDKSAAEHGRRRVSEGTLLGLGLLGGWPGAVVAQQFLRHKTSKASFQASFWVSVVANVLTFVGLHAPWSDLPR